MFIIDKFRFIERFVKLLNTGLYLSETIFYFPFIETEIHSAQQPQMLLDFKISFKYFGK